MANRDIFSKHLPNVKLASRIDADGKETQVERREDAESTEKEGETFEMLVAAGYYRAKIKGLSAFDKVVGGMTWCIECCDYDVDVDLLFQENSTIGQKIALVEKIVSVLPQMNCPYQIEPHQIQGLEFLSIHPVIQWLVKKSVENRAERGQRLRKFAIEQFHNHFQYKSDIQNLKKVRDASEHIRKIQNIYSPCRRYKRKDTKNEDEKTRVRMTLLEYGDTGGAIVGSSTEIAGAEALNAEEREIDVDRLLKNFYVAEEDLAMASDQESKKTLQSHYEELMYEMEMDLNELSEQGELKLLEEAEAALDKKMKRTLKENEELEIQLEKVTAKSEELKKEETKLREEINEMKKIEEDQEPKLVAQVKELVKTYDDLQKEEIAFKEQCRQDLENLQKELDKKMELSEKDDTAELEEQLAREKENLKQLRLILAKKNRAVVAAQRKLDSVPGRAELAQYQRRFMELYNQVSAKHSETKQLYAEYNTLNDTKRYYEKEIALLTSIYETHQEGLTNPQSREQFLKQFENIVESVKQTKLKLQQKHDDQVKKRDNLNAQLMELINEQREYAEAVKELTIACQEYEASANQMKQQEAAAAAAAEDQTDINT